MIQGKICMHGKHVVYVGNVEIIDVSEIHKMCQCLFCIGAASQPLTLKAGQIVIE